MEKLASLQSVQNWHGSCADAVPQDKAPACFNVGNLQPQNLTWPAPPAPGDNEYPSWAEAGKPPRGSLAWRDWQKAQKAQAQKAQEEQEEQEAKEEEASHE